MEQVRKSEHTTVRAVDLKSHANANHDYKVVDNIKDERLARIHFQEGAIQEHGVNGVQLEDLLAICVHRLEGFQDGQFACEPNQVALDHIKVAIAALDARTAERKVRGVEGKSIK